MSAFQIPLPLTIEPTIAMRRGEQLIWQCAQCGLVAVQTNLAPGRLGACPACSGATWWQQELPVAGLRNPTTSTVAPANETPDEHWEDPLDLFTDQEGHAA